MINVKRNLSADSTFYNHGEVEVEGRGDCGSRLILRLARWTSPRAVYISQSVQFSRSVVSDSLRPHESQHARPVHHQLPEFTQTHVHQVSDAIQPSHPGSSPSPPVPNLSQHQSFPMSQLFA